MHKLYASRHSDAFMIRDSKLQSQWLEAHLSNGLTLDEVTLIYADRGYFNSVFIRAAFKKLAGRRLLPWQREENNVMKKPRCCPEWGFGDTKNQRKWLGFVGYHKIQLSCVAKHYLVGTLLANFHTCLYGGVSCTYFSKPPDFVLLPPTLNEYLGNHNVYMPEFPPL